MRIELLAGKLLVMALGLLIAYQGFRGYRRNHSEPMFFVAIGFLFLTAGGTMGCTLIHTLGISAFSLGIAQTVLVATGMGFVLYSLYG
ncbi:DUF7521 family protein [Haladaptatus cibarius]|uniref:DUF7521 family protein n=1 Tax=Haladaptatus cibarius TaxID=453847 RepID=UPI00067895C4|nr:hypothetical protein [Haladaptatus cibarius]